jgi:hypothetical protein
LRAQSLRAVGETQARLRMIEEARQTYIQSREEARRIPDPFLQASALAMIAEGFARADLASDAQDTFRRASDSAQKVSNALGRALAQLLIADAHLRLNRSLDVISNHSRALSEARGNDEAIRMIVDSVVDAQISAGFIQEGFNTAALLLQITQGRERYRFFEITSSIIEMLDRFGRHNEIYDVLRAQLREANGIDDSAKIRIQAAIAMARVGRFNDANALLGEARQIYRSDRVYNGGTLSFVADSELAHGTARIQVHVAASHARAGRIQEARSAAAEISDSGVYAAWRGRAIVAVVEAQLRAGQLDAALQSVREITDQAARDDAQRLVAEAHISIGQLQPGLRIARGIPDAFKRARSLIAAADALASSGMLNEAQAILLDAGQQAIDQDSEFRQEIGRVIKDDLSTTLREVTRALARHQMHREAQDMAERIPHELVRVEALRDIAVGESQRGNVQRAAGFFATSISAALEIGLASVRANVLADTAVMQARAGFIGEAEQTARMIGDRADTEHLRDIHPDNRLPFDSWRILSMLSPEIRQDRRVSAALGAPDLQIGPRYQSLYVPSFDTRFLRRASSWTARRDAREVALIRIFDTDHSRSGRTSAWCFAGTSTQFQSRTSQPICGIAPGMPDWGLEARDYRVAVSDAGDRMAVANLTTGQVWRFDSDSGISSAAVVSSNEVGNIESLEFSANGRLLLQTNSDGRFFIFDVATAARILSGVGLDDEFVIYDEHGFYDATPEGGSYVYRFFPALREHHSFAQFRAHFHRPDIIRDLIAGRPVTRPSITLLAPPTVEFEARLDPSGSGRVELIFEVRGPAQLRTLRLFRDGLPLTELPVSGNSARFSHAIQLLPGRHNISAVAYDALGFSSNVKTAAVQIGQDRRYQGRLRYVGVAVNNYHRMAADQNLEFAVRDAQLMLDSLLGLRSIRHGEVSGTLLTDAQATRTAILETLRRAAVETGPDDTLVISFAGHGARVGERFFYLPHGGSFADAAETGVEWRLIAEALSAAQGRVLVLLDACHSGSASGDNLVPNDAYAEQLMRNGRAGLAVLAASKGRQFSYEDPNLGGGHGQFSYTIAQALGPDRATADRDRSGTIELDELYAYVKRIVSTSTRSVPTGVQTPWLARDEFIGRVSIF